MNLLKRLIYLVFLGMLMSACGDSTESSTNETNEKLQEKSEKKAREESNIQKQPVDMERYKEQLDMGEKLFNSGTYQEALKHYNAAAEFNNSTEIQEKIANTIDKCYQEFVDKGKKYMAEDNYLYAKKEFETARIFRNIDEVNNLLKTCKEKL